MDDNLSLLRRPSPSEIIRQLRENPATSPLPPETETADGSAAADAAFGPESFDPNSTDYKACGWVGNKPVPSLRLILKDRSERGFTYAHLDSLYPGGCEFLRSLPGRGNVIRLRIAGASASFTVELEGRNLRRLWELVMGHLTPWVAEYPADIDTLGDQEAVVKAITFKPEK